MRQRVYTKQKVNTEKTLNQLENEALESLDKQMEEQIKKDQELQFVPAPSSTISKPANLQPVHFDSVEDIRNKINSLCVSIIDTKMNNRSNDAVRVRAAEVLAKTNGLGISDKDQTQLILEVLMLFNTFVSKKNKSLSSSLISIQREFMEVVLSTSNLNHLTFVVNAIGEEKIKSKPGRKKDK